MAAILDGAPNPHHQLLINRLLSDYPDNLAALYQPGGRKHETAMANRTLHEKLAGGSKISAFQDGDDIILQIRCYKDACEKRDDRIPYGLALTLEIAEEAGIPIYQQIRERIKLKIPNAPVM